MILVGAVAVGTFDALRNQPVAAQSATQAVTTQGVNGQASDNGQGGGGWRGGREQTRSQAGGGAGRGAQGNPTNTTSGTPQSQANVTDWVTVNGTVKAAQATGLSVTSDAGEPVWLQLGQPNFWQNQGVTFNVGDRVSIVGFYENEQLQAKSVTNDTTQQTLTLRDATGRPLWAGGGRNH